MANKFTNRERKLLIYVGLFCGVMLAAWLIFAPKSGILDMLKARKRLDDLQAENQKLAEENMALRQEIDRLQNDPAYLEERARKEYGLLKENEVLYVFDKKKKK